MSLFQNQSWQDWVNDLANGINTLTGVAGNIGATVQGLQNHTYQNQQQQQQQQQLQQTKSNNKFMYLLFGFLGLFLIFRH